MLFGFFQGETGQPRWAWRAVCGLIAVLAAGFGPPAHAQAQAFDIKDYHITGVHLLARTAVEEAVYPYLGPHLTVSDIEKARAALAALYTAKGYGTVEVIIPPQRVLGGVVTLAVIEGKVGRLNVVGSRYFSLDKVRAEAPSLAPGVVPNYQAIKRDIIALNQIPDRHVTPVFHAGKRPGTVDVDLAVKDTLPIHGSLELNNRYSEGTSPLRLNASLSYGDLWQRGDTVSISYQVAPENPNDAEVFSGSYLARLPSVPWLTFLLYGLSSNSNVSTLGETNVAGRGQVVGARAIFELPNRGDFFQSLSLGMDYKHFGENISFSGTQFASPITYYPLVASYTALWQSATGSVTELDMSGTWDFRSFGSDPGEFDNRRFDSAGDFSYLRGSLSRQQELPFGAELYAKMQGQFSPQPLVDSEEFSGGGLDTVRGYLESEVLGDNAAIGSVEMRSPSLAGLLKKPVDDWRFYAFAEGGVLTVDDPLPQQQSVFDLASIGIGTHVKLIDHLNGSVDVAVPLVSQIDTRAGDARINFRIWYEF